MRHMDERATNERHPDDGTLQAWLDHPRSGMLEAETRAIEAHLAECEACAARVQALEEDSSSVRDLLEATPAAAPPPFAAIEERARRLDPSSGRSRRPARRWRGAAWAASIAVALGTGWMANDLFRTSPGARGGFSDEAVVAPTTAPELDAGSSPQAGTAAQDESATPVDGARAGDPVVSSDRAGSVAPAPDEAPSVAAEAMPPVPARAGEPEGTVIRGRVIDAQSGRPLEAAQVWEPSTRSGVLTDATGSFALPLPPGAAAPADSGVTLQVRLIGYSGEARRVALNPDAPEAAVVLGDVPLQATALRLQEVVVEEEDSAPEGAPSRPVAVDPAAISWRATEPSAAEARAGFALRTIPELEVGEVATASIGGEVLVRVHQVDPEGTTITILQSRRSFRLTGSEDTEDRTAEGVVGAVTVVVLLPDGAAGAAALLNRIR